MTTPSPDNGDGILANLPQPSLAAEISNIALRLRDSDTDPRILDGLSMLVALVSTGSIEAAAEQCALTLRTFSRRLAEMRESLGLLPPTLRMRNDEIAATTLASLVRPGGALGAMAQHLSEPRAFGRPVLCGIGQPEVEANARSQVLSAEDLAAVCWIVSRLAYSEDPGDADLAQRLLQLADELVFTPPMGAGKLRWIKGAVARMSGAEFGAIDRFGNEDLPEVVACQPPQGEPVQVVLRLSDGRYLVYERASDALTRDELAAQFPGLTTQLVDG